MFICRFLHANNPQNNDDHVYGESTRKAAVIAKFYLARLWTRQLTDDKAYVLVAHQNALKLYQ